MPVQYIFLIAMEDTSVREEHLCCYHSRHWCLQDIYFTSTGDADVCAELLFLPQETLVSVRNIHVATAGDPGVCRTLMLLPQEIETCGGK
jgi:hypothetical protein